MHQDSVTISCLKFSQFLTMVNSNNNHPTAVPAPHKALYKLMEDKIWATVASQTHCLASIIPAHLRAVTHSHGVRPRLQRLSLRLEDECRTRDLRG